jgi:hypothetical protein
LLPLYVILVISSVILYYESLRKDLANSVHALVYISFFIIIIIIKALGSILNILHIPFNNAFLIRGMKMMMMDYVQKLASWLLPSATVC